MSKKIQALVIPITAVILGLLFGALIMLLFGYNPVDAYIALFQGAFGDSFYLGETIRQATPYILVGLSIAIAFKAGLFNIGAEGQLLMGWIGAVSVALSFDGLSKWIHLPLALLAGIIFGAIWAFIPGILKATLRVNEVIVTIMLNYTALYIFNYIVQNVLTNQMDKTKEIPATASLQSPFLQEMTQYSSLHWGILIAVGCALIMWLVIDKTTFGYELKSVGFNQNASKYAGMSVAKTIVISMIIAGGLAGLAGAMEGLGNYGTAYVLPTSPGTGFDGIAVALLGGNSPIGIIFSAILFGALKVGSLNMPAVAGVPNELVNVVIALIIFFVASSYIIRWAMDKFAKKGAKTK
ncbi:ABC transporter permease [Listeria booriae]|uniref:ABC transporter permease n=1 Tax=Listeria booriae TaxID=1552123 RepID=A0A7X0ZKH2_9LIST|nr:ABC transporter permease [Listeria booriae]MBC1492008.1 ABC transporter permease [Listeria booriae]MBC1503883.1 ABC transporter permease [Listeria booriae]MBC1511818.1 ABC transporter permease [Listeria booriae]MBC1529177.1 ABC transporter permease [Listeria booriae]MBC2256999.1 ABC transporter permease [Listeria booriae]